MAGTDPVLRHVRHAEGWLRRARYDWRRGDVRAAVLRLMLAEAEIRHARETQGRGVDARDRRRGGVIGRRAAAAVAAAAVLAAGAGYAAVRWNAAPRITVAARAARPGRPGVETTQPIVQLDSGRFLMFGLGRNGAGGPVHLAVPVDLRTTLPTF